MNAQRRLRRSYEMMLGFYGVLLDGGNSLHRAVNWDERFDNLRRCLLFAYLVARVYTCLAVMRTDSKHRQTSVHTTIFSWTIPCHTGPVSLCLDCLDMLIKLLFLINVVLHEYPLYGP